jgi:AcrR family transcriptional regulator
MKADKHRQDRKYTLKRRAAKQDETRSQIIDAIMALHEEVGPRNTTISAIAERAGVQRLTVYRHFPNEADLFAACTRQWLANHPPPNFSQWQEIEAISLRLQTALLAFYNYYRRTERMWTVAYRDQNEIPALKAEMDKFQSYLEQVRDSLARMEQNSPVQQRILQAIIGHCIQFSTWRSLAREGLSDLEMADLAVRWLISLRSEDTFTSSVNSSK